jgi:hypothetical protein
MGMDGLRVWRGRARRRAPGRTETGYADGNAQATWGGGPPEHARGSSPGLFYFSTEAGNRVVAAPTQPSWTRGRSGEERALVDEDHRNAVARNALSSTRITGMRRRGGGQEGGNRGRLHREETRRRRAPLGLVWKK